MRNRLGLPFLLMQTPFQEIALPSYIEIIDKVLHMLYLLSIRGYVVLIFAGMLVYATSLSDGAAKSLIVVGVVLHFAGPFMVTHMMNVAGVGPFNLEKAELAWRGVFGIGDRDVLTLILMIGDALVAVVLLIGAIMYFTPSSSELKKKGQSLITRGFVLLPALAFYQIFVIL